MRSGRSLAAEARGAGPGGSRGRQRACAGRARQSPPAPRKSALPGLRSRRGWVERGPPGGRERGVSCADSDTPSVFPAVRVPRLEAVFLSSRSLWGRTAHNARVEAVCPHRWLGSRRLTWDGGRTGRSQALGPQDRREQLLRISAHLRAPRSRAPPCRPRAVWPSEGRPRTPARVGAPPPPIRWVPSPVGSGQRCSPQIPERTTRPESAAEPAPLRQSRLQISRPRSPAHAVQGAGAGPAPRCAQEAARSTHPGGSTWAGRSCCPSSSP